MDFEWDETKARKNRRKHGISFLEATKCLQMNTPPVCTIRIIHIMSADTCSLVNSPVGMVSLYPLPGG
nr:MAG: Ribonuclease toxin, BrnT, of type II toxin-antitoxin system [Candidatus Kentron sp. TUN]VFK65559.1 MAG: Ribonuclease toxin, BrnT, of type II toxin-antitoxin system [Candidatus Kentron sp. TUN]